MKAKKPKKRLAVSKKRIHALMHEQGACTESYARVDKMLRDPEKHIRLYNRYWFTDSDLNLNVRQIAADLAFIGVRLRFDAAYERRKLSIAYINGELKRLCEGYGI